MFECCYLFFGREICHPLIRYDIEKFTVPGISHLKDSTKICVKEMKEKSVTFTKGKSKFLENKRGYGDFSVENLGLFFQNSGNIKLEIITRN